MILFHFILEISFWAVLKPLDNIITKETLKQIVLIMKEGSKSVKMKIFAALNRKLSKGGRSKDVPPYAIEDSQKLVFILAFT